MSASELGPNAPRRSERAQDILQAIPFLRVASMEHSLRFYVDGLGFELVERWVDDGAIRWCRLVRGGGSLMLQDTRQDDGSRWVPSGPVGLGVSIMFLCEDALAVYREAVGRGLVASNPFVGNGMWVTSLRDPDGYLIEFESVTDAPEETEFDG